jgi:hypothetical protein
VTRKRDSDIPQGLSGCGLHRRHPGHSVGHRDDVAGDSVSFARPGVQSGVVAILQGFNQDLGKG